jgi:hypothetical protein
MIIYLIFYMEQLTVKPWKVGIPMLHFRNQYS